MLTSSHSTKGELTEKPLSFAVGLVREAIQRVTDRNMKSAMDYLEVNGGNLSMNAILLISSWAKVIFRNHGFRVGTALSRRPRISACEGTSSIPLTSNRVFQLLP